MKKAPAILAVIGSIPFFVLGLLFLIASASGANRILVAAALLAIATVLLVAGLRRLRRLAAIQPDALETGAVELARRLGGELTISQLRAEYGISAEEAGKVLEKLVHEGSCRREQREDRLVKYVRIAARNSRYARDSASAPIAALSSRSPRPSEPRPLAPLGIASCALLRRLRSLAHLAERWGIQRHSTVSASAVLWPRSPCAHLTQYHAIARP